MCIFELILFHIFPVTAQHSNFYDIKGPSNLDNMKWNAYYYENIFILFLTYHEYRTFQEPF